MPPPSKPQPTATEYALDAIFKWFIKANEDNRWALIQAHELYRWRREVQDALLSVWRDQTTLAGRQYFDKQMARARADFVKRGFNQREEQLPTVDTLRRWMFVPFDPVADAAASSSAHSLAKGPPASISERTAQRYGTTRSRWEAEAQARWAEEQRRASRRS